MHCTDAGQGLLEYSLVMLFVVLVVFGGLLMLGPHLANIFGTIHNVLYPTDGTG